MLVIAFSGIFLGTFSAKHHSLCKWGTFITVLKQPLADLGHCWNSVLRFGSIRLVQICRAAPLKCKKQMFDASKFTRLARVDLVSNPCFFVMVSQDGLIARYKSKKHALVYLLYLVVSFRLGRNLSTRAYVGGSEGLYQSVSSVQSRPIYNLS